MFRALLFILILSVACAVGWWYYQAQQPAGDEVDAIDVSFLSDFEKGQYYFNHGDNPDGAYDLTLARQYYEQTITASTTGNDLVWYQLGRIDFIEGKFDAAISKFNKQVLYHGDTVPNVYYMIGLTYGFKAKETDSADDWQAAEDNFLTYITYDPDGPWPRVDLAWVYFAQGKYADVRTAIEPAVAAHPTNAWVLNMYGLALLNTDDDATLARDIFYRAHDAAADLSPADWGRVYPGNDPANWPSSLIQFRGVVADNIDLAEAALADQQ